jgi:hypothetical protein
VQTYIKERSVNKGKRSQQCIDFGKLSSKQWMRASRQVFFKRSPPAVQLCKGNSMEIRRILLHMEVEEQQTEQVNAESQPRGKKK